MCIYHLVETLNMFYWKDNIHWKKTSWEKSWRFNTACPHKEPDCVGETGAQGGSVFWHTSLLPCAHFLCCSKRSNDTNEEIDTMTKATATAFLLWPEESHQVVEECARDEQRERDRLCHVSSICEHMRRPREINSITSVMNKTKRSKGHTNADRTKHCAIKVWFQYFKLKYKPRNRSHCNTLVNLPSCNAPELFWNRCLLGRFFL